MEEVSCDICIKEFNESDVVPRVLECGHSFCSECLTKLIQTSKLCPKCRNGISQVSFEAYPVNYTLLSFANVFKDLSKPNRQITLQRRFATAYELYAEAQARFIKNKEAVQCQLNLITDGINQIKEGFSKLQTLSEIVLEDDDMDLHTVAGTLFELTTKLETICSVAAVGISENLKLTDYASPKEFLLEIYNGLVRGEHYYATTKIGDQDKYGKFSIFDNKLFMHAFDSIGMDHRAKMVSLQDIKTCLAKVKFDPFLEFIRNDQGIIQRIIVEMLCTILTPQFIKFCTGEKGPVYKGSPFYQGNNFSDNSRYAVTISSIVKVDKLLLSDEDINDCMAYAGFEFTSSCNNGSIYLEMSYDGSFEIHQLNSQHNSQSMQVKNVVGIIRSPTNLNDLISYGQKSKIIDSGIAIHI